jgi:hypothetical protein
LNIILQPAIDVAGFFVKLLAVRCSLFAEHTHNCGSHSLWESRKLQAASGKQSRHTMEKKQYFIIAHAIHYIHAVRCALLAVRRSYTQLKLKPGIKEMVTRIIFR